MRAVRPAQGTMCLPVGEVRGSHRPDPCLGVSVITGKTGHACKKIVSNNRGLQ